MKRKELIKMYIDWTTRADDEIKMSDWLCACFEADIDPDEIQELGDKILHPEEY